MPLALDVPPPALYHVEARVGFNASGFTRGPGGIVLSWFSWWGAYGALDLGVYRLGPATFTVGVGAWYNRPFLLERVATRLTSSVLEGTWEFELVDKGASGRVGVSFRHESVFQPYVVLGVGRDSMHMGFSYEGNAGRGSGALQQKGTLVAPGGGFELVGKSGFVFGVELDYRIFRTFVTSEQLNVETAGGQPLVAVEKSEWQIPPRGFSWILTAGWRF